MKVGENPLYTMMARYLELVTAFWNPPIYAWSKWRQLFVVKYNAYTLWVEFFLAIQLAPSPNPLNSEPVFKQLGLFGLL